MEAGRRSESAQSVVPMTGLVLCGGASTRMGTDKATLLFSGERLIDRVYRRLATVAHPILFAPGTVGRLGELPGMEVADMIENGGPMGGMAAGLAASPYNLVGVVAVDMPMCSPRLFQLAATLWSGEDAIVPRDRHGPQVLHAIYARSALPKMELALAADRNNVRELLDDLDVLYLDEDSWRPVDPSGSFAANLNSPADLARLSSL